MHGQQYIYIKDTGLTVQIMKLHITQFCPNPCHIFPVRSTHSSQHPYLQTHSVSKMSGHDSNYQDCGLLGRDIVLFGTQAPSFRQDLLLPSS